MSDHTPISSRAPRLPSLRVVALTLGIGLAATMAYAATAPAPHALSATDAPSWMERMHGHSHAQMHAHFEQVLVDAGTSPAQRQQIHGIMKAAMEAEHADMRAYHASCGQLKDLLDTPAIDQGALAAVRLDQDRLALAMSRRLSDTALRVAQVLTPDQRRTLGGEIDRMMHNGVMPGGTMHDGMEHHAR